MPQPQQRFRAKSTFFIVQRLLVTWGLAIASILLIVFIHHQSSATEETLDWHKALPAVTPASLAFALPTPQPHPLPLILAQWQDPTNSGDYFSQVRPTKVGYLVWSLFPIKVYIEQPVAFSNTNQAQSWQTAVLQAVQEWRAYLPLVMVKQPESADISIWRSAPPLRFSPTDNSPRARSAETRYELYIKQTSSNQGMLSHRYNIWLSPNQTSEYIQASARHELGHALGIWGHSPVITDALYFSQVRNPPPISARDINTLKRVYQQPTSLGWDLENKLELRKVLLEQYLPDV